MQYEIRIYDRKLKYESSFLEYEGNIQLWKGDISQLEISKDEKTLYILVHKTQSVTAYSLLNKQKIWQSHFKEKNGFFEPNLGVFLENHRVIAYWQDFAMEIYEFRPGNFLLKQTHSNNFSSLI